MWGSLEQITHGVNFIQTSLFLYSYSLIVYYERSRYWNQFPDSIRRSSPPEHTLRTGRDDFSLYLFGFNIFHTVQPIRKQRCFERSDHLVLWSNFKTPNSHSPWLQPKLWWVSQMGPPSPHHFEPTKFNWIFDSRDRRAITVTSLACLYVLGKNQIDRMKEKS